MKICFEMKLRYKQMLFLYNITNSLEKVFNLKITMIHLVQATIVALLVSVSSSYVIAKRFSRPAISSRPYKSVEKYKIYSSGPSDASSHTEKMNSSSLFELEVCDYGKNIEN